MLEWHLLLDFLSTHYTNIFHPLKLNWKYSGVVVVVNDSTSPCVVLWSISILSNSSFQSGLKQSNFFTMAVEERLTGCISYDSEGHVCVLSVLQMLFGISQGMHWWEAVSEMLAARTVRKAARYITRSFATRLAPSTKFRWYMFAMRGCISNFTRHGAKMKPQDG